MVAHGDDVHTRKLKGLELKELPERLVSPRGSSLGSLETLGVAQPTINRSKNNTRFCCVF